MKRLLVTALVGVMSMIGAEGALAQKSKDTLRIPLKFPIDFISYLYSGNVNETHFSTLAVFDTLVMFDEDALKFTPLLAKSWKRVDDRTLEFELRDDVTWHDGEKFGADDVVDSLMWLINPGAKIANAGNWAWIAKAEKLGPTTVRVIEKSPTPHDLARLATGTDIYPAHILAKMPDRMQFGRKPVGTGMYRATQVDTNAGIVLTRNPGYKMASPAKPMSNIGKVHLLAIPEPATQMAQLLADGVEAIKEPEVDQVPDLLKDPRFTFFFDQRISYVYMAIDAQGVAGQKALADVRVRKALFLALDRDVTTRMSAGDVKVSPPPAMCWKPLQAGCDYAGPLPKQDIAEAKRLLAEAGYPNGFDLQISCYTGTRYKRISEVVAEQFRQIGVRPTIQCVPAGTYLKLKRENKVQLVLAGFPAGSMADAAGVLNLFADPQRLDFHGDQEIFGWANAFRSEPDPAKRLALGRNIFTAYTERAYVLPVAPIPSQYVHRKEVEIKGGTIQTPGVQIGHFNWKK